MEVIMVQGWGPTKSTTVIVSSFKAKFAKSNFIYLLICCMDKYLILVGWRFNPQIKSLIFYTLAATSGDSYFPRLTAIIDHDHLSNHHFIFPSVPTFCFASWRLYRHWGYFYTHSCRSCALNQCKQPLCPDTPTYGTRSKNIAVNTPQFYVAF